jgi:PKD repeat protein
MFPHKPKSNFIYLFIILLLTAPVFSQSPISLDKTISRDTKSLINSIQLHSNSPIKEGDDLIVSTTFYNDLNYKWLGPNNKESDDSWLAIYNVQEENAGIYTLKVSDNNGFTKSYQIEVEINTIDTNSLTYRKNLRSVNFEDDQNGNIWLFGSEAGVDFNSGTPVDYIGSAMTAWEGCATICDDFGQLMFYSNGLQAFNKDHEVMPNGDGLLGDQSSTQSGVIVPYPNHPNKFFLFTVDEESHEEGLNYSVVDMTLHGGKGDITEKNIQLLTPTCEKIAAVKHENGIDYWIVTRKTYTDEIWAFLITEDGVNPNAVVTSDGYFPLVGSSSDHGYAKFSPSGRKLAMAGELGELVKLYDFDTSTGVASNLIQIIHLPSAIAYGIEFSPSERYLYVTYSFGNISSEGHVNQFDISSNDEEEINDSQIKVCDTDYSFYAMQIGPDRKIYIANGNEQKLSCLNFPDQQGTSAGFQDVGVSLTNECRLGLPALIASYYKSLDLYSENHCFGDETQFTIGNPEDIIWVEWDFDDPESGANNISNLLNPTHIFSEPGNYGVSVIAHYASGNQESVISIEIESPPNIFAGSDQTINNNQSTSLAGVLYGNINEHTIIWSPTSLVSNPNILNPVTVNLMNTTTFTLSATNNESGCQNSDEVTINVYSPLVTGLEADPPGICQGESTTISVNVSGGSGSYNYFWLSDPPGFSSTFENIEVSPSVTTTYFCRINDGVNPQITEEITIEVASPPTLSVIEDQFWCSNDPYPISGVTASNYSSISWTTTGTGSFDDHQTLNPIYTPSNEDLEPGDLTLSIELIPIAPCNDILTESFTLSLSGINGVDAGDNYSLCDSAQIELSQVEARYYEDLTWTSSGTGMFSNSHDLNPIYTISDDDYDNGHVRLYIEAINSICGNTSDSVDLFLYKTPEVFAGTDVNICENSSYTITDAIVENYTTLNWSSEGDGSFNDNSLLSPTYTPGINDKLGGSVNLILQALNDPSCDDIYTDTIALSITPEIIFNAGADTSLCGPVEHTIISFTGSNFTDIEWTSTGTGVFSNTEPDPLHPTFTPGIGDVTTDVIITANATNGVCPNVTQSVSSAIYIIPLIYPEGDTIICEDQVYDMNTVDVQFYYSLDWFTAGDGSFSDTQILNPVYTPGTNDINNGGVTLTLEADIDTPCEGPFFEEMFLGIQKSPTLNMGNDTSWCEPLEHQITGVVATDADYILWTTSGSGFFNDASLLNPTYTPSEDDMNAGNITLTITVDNMACDPVSDNKIITLNHFPIYEAGNDQVICSNEQVITYEATAEYYNTISWTTSGDGSFDIANALNSIYTPSAQDIAVGTVTLTMEVITDASCGGPFTDNFVVTILPEPVLEVGNDTTVCNLISHQINGVIAQNYQTIAWSTSGTGTFMNGDTDSPSYAPSDADYTAGTVTLTATLTQTACADINDSFVMTIVKDPVVNAGVDTDICSTENYTLADATIDEYYTNLQWTSSGTGTFNNSTILNPVYNPSLNDITAGPVTLTLEAFTDAPCNDPFTDNMILDINYASFLDAGPDTTVCDLLPHTIVGTVAQDYQTITWTTSGSGTLTNANTETPTYTPSEDDYNNGTITITCTLTQTACTDNVDSFEMTIVKHPEVYAGADVTICSVDPHSLVDATISEHYTSLQWTSSGTGSFSNTTIVNPVYYPSPEDIAAGNVTLTFEAFTDAPCPGTFTDNMTITINEAPILEVGADRTVCDLIAHPITGVTAQNFQSITWSSSGSGTFTGGNTANPSYTPSEEDYINGSVVITADMVQLPCDDISDSFVMTIKKHPEVFAGDDITICEIETPQLNLATINEHYTSFQWSTSGTGSFDNTSVLHPVYFPSAEDANNGMVTLTLEAFTDAPCPGTFTDDVLVTIMKEPIIDAGEDKLVCNTIPHLIDSATAINFQSMFWASSGTGTFSAGNTISPTYTPSDADMESGFVVLTLTVSNPPCADQVDQMTLQIAHPPIVDAGEDLIMCAQEPFVIGGASAEYYTSLQWTSSGTGSVVNATTLAPQYIPSEADIAAGTVTLTLEAFTDNPCDGTFTDQMLLNIVPQPVVNAGANETICEGDTLFIADATAINYEELFWTTSGSGNFINGLNPSSSYIHSNWDVDNSPVTLTLNAVNTPCSNIKSSRDLSIIPLADVWAGPDTVIEGGQSYHNTLSIVGNYTHYQWYTSGSGTFDNPTFMNPIYTPSPMDTIMEFVYLYVEAESENSCGNVVDSMKLIINHNPYVDFYVQHPCTETPIQFSADTIIIDTEKTIEYFWDFGDGNSSFEMNPIHTYTEANTYEVILRITDTLNQQYSEHKYIQVDPLPYAYFSHSRPACLEALVTFNDESNVPAGHITTWHYDFGDGSDTLIYYPNSPDNITHSYEMDMTYDVILTVETDQGCVNHFTDQIDISPSPIALFEYSDPCQQMQATFSSQAVTNGSSSIVHYLWNFDDPQSGTNNTAEGENAVHIFDIPGIYNVEHIVTNDLGCSDTINQAITILEQPLTDFTYSGNCMDQNVSFTIDESFTSLNDLSITYWDFGDGNFSWQPNPTHTYSETGVYLVRLYIENQQGCSNSISKLITVTEAPSALFDFSYPTCYGHPVDFTFISNPQSEYIVIWNWDFGNGETATIHFPDDPNLNIQYQEAGIYNVSLEVINASGCTASYSTDVTVQPAPVANLSYDLGCEDNEVQFTSLAQGNGAGEVSHFLWNFGDELSGIDNTSDLENPIHIYENPGIYDISLTVTSVNGCSDTRDTSIMINETLDIDFSYYSSCISTPVMFNSSAHINENSVTEYLWNFGDGFTSTEKDPEHIYENAGEHNVSLTITNLEGCISSISKTVHVLNDPSAAFSFEGENCEGSLIQFEDESTADNLISLWTWDFGDGTVVSVDYPSNPNISHVYQEDGTYTVTLTIITESVCQSIYTEEFEIQKAPEALINVQTTCLDEAFGFEGEVHLNGGTDIWQWKWNFGDPMSGSNNTSELQDCYHIFSSPGTYNVSLEVTNMDGCSHIKTTEITIGNLPEAAMIVSEPGCLGDEIYLEPDPDIVDYDAIESIIWNMGDGNEFELSSLEYTYESAGFYEITMTLTDTSGCIVSTSYEVVINEKPIAQFGHTVSCQANETYFTDNSYDPSGHQITGWDWDFDAIGSPGTYVSGLQNPSHIYSETGEYLVKLVLTSESGCLDSTALLISVQESPSAGFISNTNHCEAGKVTFIDTSLNVNNTPLTDWLWTFEDGYYSDEQNPFHIFENTGQSYEVSLTVTDISGCENTTEVEINVPQSLEVDFTYTTTCLGEITNFNDLLISPYNGNLIEWNWNFGDASSGSSNFSNEQAPSHNYSSPGNYVVTLSATDENYCSYTISKSIEIFPLPVAQFDYEQEQCSNDIAFTDLSTVSLAPIQQWEWNWGDGTPNTIINSTQTNPILHTYIVEGEYEVSLTVLDTNNCIGYYSTTVVKDPCVLAEFDLSTDSVCSRSSFQISDLSIPNNDIDTLTFDMGDGTQYIFNQDTYSGYFEHTYFHDSTYNIILNVRTTVTGNHYTSSKTQSIVVLSTPVAAFEVDNVCQGFESVFVDKSRDSSDVIISWNWDLGDNINSANVQDTSFVYDNYGSYEVNLEVENSLGCMDQTSSETRVYANPIPDFSWNNSCLSKPTFFYDESKSREEDQRITSWFWDFGNPEFNWDTISIQDPSWIYDSIRTHTVTLIASDNHDCRSEISQDVNTYDIPKANFRYIESQETQGHLHLYNHSEGATSITWEYLDIFNNESNPILNIKEDGTYTIQLIAENEYHCSDTMFMDYDMLFKTLFIPNAFSPNNHQESIREFLPVGRNLKEYKLEIFDLRSNLIFESKALDEEGRPTEGWDGTYRGISMPAGVYVYHVTGIFIDGSVYKGTVIGDYKNSQRSNKGQLLLIR